MCARKPTTQITLKLILLFAALATSSVALAFEPGQEPPNEMCFGCHGMPGFGMTGSDGAMKQLHISADGFNKSVHAKRACLECH